MKAVTPSIALVTLVAFVGLALPCFCSGHPYLELAEFLARYVPVDSPQALALETNVLCAKRFLYEQNQTPYEGFPNLVLAFSTLYDGRDDRVLCEHRSLLSLRVLFRAGLEYHETSSNQNEKVARLNQLLINQKSEAVSRCYKYVDEKWNDMKMQWRDGKELPGPEFIFINNKIKAKHGLFKQLIDGLSGAPPLVRRNYINSVQEIMYEALFRGERGPDLPRTTLDEFQDHVHKRFVYRCDSMEVKPVVKETAIILRYLLSLEKMILPGDSDCSEDKWREHQQMIFPLALYLYCEWLNSLKHDERVQMIANFYSRMKLTGSSSS